MPSDHDDHNQSAARAGGSPNHSIPCIRVKLRAAITLAALLVVTGLALILTADTPDTAQWGRTIILAAAVTAVYAGILELTLIALRDVHTHIGDVERHERGMARTIAEAMADDVRRWRDD